MSDNIVNESCVWLKIRVSECKNNTDKHRLDIMWRMMGDLELTSTCFS